MKKVIIAGSYDQYLRCLKENNLKRHEVPYITTPSQIERYDESIEPIYFGTFWENSTIDEIERIMKSKGIKVRGKYVKTNE